MRLSSTPKSQKAPRSTTPHITSLKHWTTSATPPSPTRPSNRSTSSTRTTGTPSPGPCSSTPATKVTSSGSRPTPGSCSTSRRSSRRCSSSLNIGFMESRNRLAMIRIVRRRQLGYLNSQQTLADYAVLIRSLKRNLSAEAAPVVAFGGSYGGMLAAWFRLKYPHITIGALASSAPILQFDDRTPWTSFYDGVSLDFKEES
ncbi:putative serine protease EDA2 [Acorus calamus]|uniref:Serine protease EDA2 n=1 Tax=Acorus calamus TaxID=4465 RepID=A0AAV9FCK8_ACOCL|nr:putative serine protease EDA2 [Acorus calamus]